MRERERHINHASARRRHRKKVRGQLQRNEHNVTKGWGEGKFPKRITGRTDGRTDQHRKEEFWKEGIVPWLRG